MKLNNNRAPGLDEIAAELVKYAPLELWEVIKTVLNECFEKHEHIGVGKGALLSIQKPGKPRGLLKKLRPVIWLQIIRKILSNIAIRRMQDRYKAYFSISKRLQTKS